MAESSPVKPGGAVPVSDRTTDEESEEAAAEFSAVLASAVNGFTPVPRQELQLPIEVPGDSLVGAEMIESNQSLSLWNLVPVVPEDVEATNAPVNVEQADEFAAETLQAFRTTETGVDVPLTIKGETPHEVAGKTADEALVKTARAPLDRTATPHPALSAGKVLEAAQQASAADAAVDSSTEVTAQKVTQAAQSIEAVDVKLPSEAKVVADMSIAPVAPKETTTSSERVVEAADAHAQEQTDTTTAPARTVKTEHVRSAFRADLNSANEAKAATEVADEMPVGPFGTLRPATSAPERSVSGRQALPVEKAEGAGKEFTEAQRVLSAPTPETRPVDSPEPDSSSKVSVATPARQVSEAVHTAQRSGVRVIEMELKPEGMGTLRLKLTGPVRGTSTEGMRLEIQALDPKAHALLLDNMSELRSALGQWEIRLMPPVANQSLNGVMAGSEGRGYAQSGSQRQNGQGHADRNSQDEQADESFAEQFGSSMDQ
jgi:hypothetical protein